MSGIAGLVLLGIALVFRVTEVAQARYWIGAAVVCYVIASFQAWKRERQTITNLKGEIKSLRQSIEGLNQAEGVITLTPKALTGVFKNRTTLQGEKLAETYTGKWMIVSGCVEDIEREGERIRVVFKLAELADPIITMRFEAKFVEPISALVKGDKITVRGKIARIQPSYVSLEDCELVKF